MKGEKDFELLFQMPISKGTDGMHYLFLLRDIEKTNIADPDQTRDRTWPLIRVSVVSYKMFY